MSRKSGPASAVLNRQRTKQSEAFRRIRELSCYQLVHDRLASGWMPADIATWLQGSDTREFSDVTHRTLTEWLTAYRTVNVETPVEKLKQMAPGVVAKAADRVREAINEVEELENLYRLQMDRLAIDGALERNINKLLPSMTGEVREARNILESIAKVKAESGLTPRHLGTVSIDARIVADVQGRYGKPAVAKVLGNPESITKVLGVADRLFTLAEKVHDLPVIDTTAVVVDPASPPEEELEEMEIPAVEEEPGTPEGLARDFLRGVEAGLDKQQP